MHASSVANCRKPAFSTAGRARNTAARFKVGPFSFGTTSTVTKAEQREIAKQELFEKIAPLSRGATATEADKAEVDDLASKLEGLNPTPRPLASSLINGSWELLYTTSASILGLSKPPFLRPSGKIFQVIDAPNLKARNIETAPLYNQVSANLISIDDETVAVLFEEFRIFNLIPVKAPASARGELSVTYLDEELRISRGDKGNLFILTMDDRAKRP